MYYSVKFMLVVFAALIVDICWTMWFIESELRASVKAAAWSSLTIIITAFSTIEYVNDRTLIIAAAIGAFIGTFLSIEWKKYKERKA